MKWAVQGARRFEKVLYQDIFPVRHESNQVGKGSR